MHVLLEAAAEELLLKFSPLIATYSGGGGAKLSMDKFWGKFEEEKAGHSRKKIFLERENLFLLENGARGNLNLHAHKQSTCLYRVSAVI